MPDNQDESRRREDEVRLDEKSVLNESRQELLERLTSALDKPMSILAVVWVLILIIELTLPLPPWGSRAVYFIDIAIWVAFLLQFLLEFWIAPNKTDYLKANWITAISVALPFFRALRVLRLFRALRQVSLVSVLLRSNRAIGAVGEIVRRSRIQFIAMALGIASLAAAAGVYALEAGEPGANILTFGDAVWWSFTLVTTMNIGNDPVSFEGRVIGLVMRVIALSAFGYITAFVASYLVGEREKKDISTADLSLEDQIAQLHEEIIALRAELSSAKARNGATAPMGEQTRPTDAALE